MTEIYCIILINIKFVLFNAKYHLNKQLFMQDMNYPLKMLPNHANRWREERQNITSLLFECDEANQTKLYARILYLSTDETIKMNQIKFVFKIK